MASRPYETLYTGVTSNLVRRIYEHRNGITKGFTSRYGVRLLVWYDEFPDISSAIAQEKRVKHWRRKWKFDLIEKQNPKWIDLYGSLNE
ncbi:GIY-YIG nuclease family protein [Roseibium sp.]|uniref:GIY-YIG nuclease family protein n=1 Tax=Roseibium sp. TaxID=1936156 RepID=UPI003B51C535